MSEIKNEVEIETLQGKSITDSPLLNFARESNPDSTGLPEPVWGVEVSASEVQAVWYPSQSVLESTSEFNLLEVDTRSITRLTIELWLRYRELNEIERAKILKFVREDEQLSEEEKNKIYSLIDVPPDEEWFDTYQSIVDFPEELQTKIRNEELNARHVRYLNRMPEKLSQLLLDLIVEDRINFTVQQCKQMLDAVRRIDEQGIESLCSELEDGGMVDEGTSPRDRGLRLLEEIRESAFPRTMKKKRDFRKELESLDLHGKVNVEPPRNFEGDYLDFSFRCSRDESLDKFLEEIDRCRKLFKHV